MIDLSPLFGDRMAPDAAEFSFRIFPKSGPARWLLETKYRKPWHLKTWPRANFRARLIHRVVWSAADFGLRLPSRTECFMVAAGSAYAQLQDEFDQLGIFLGSPGPNRKIVVYAERVGRSVFVKIPLGPASAALVRNENAALSELSRDSDLARLIPRCTLAAGHLAIEDVESNGAGYGELDLTEILRIHNLLERRNQFVLTLSELRNKWEKPVDGAHIAHDSITRARLAEVRATAQSFLDSLPQNIIVPCYVAHGDFTRWNVLKAMDGTARIIDWELYGPKPLFFDPIHYFASHDLLVSRKSGTAILARLRRIWGGRGQPDLWWRHIGFYFACQAIYYAHLYERQQSLHPQAHWQLQAWLEVLQILNVSEH